MSGLALRMLSSIGDIRSPIWVADQAIPSINATKRLENRQADSRMSTAMATKAALEKGGVEFASPRGGKDEGVVLAVG